MCVIDDRAMSFCSLSSLKAAREAGVMISYYQNVGFRLWPTDKDATEGIWSIWEEADIIKVKKNRVYISCFYFLIFFSFIFINFVLIVGTG